VAGKGYIEFPIIYYDYLYDIPEHVTLLFWQNDIIRYMAKKDSGIQAFSPVTRLFFYTLQQGHDALLRAFKPLFFQGFEWEGSLTVEQVNSISELCWPFATK
ncbi:MAG: hypothetical protein H6Q75_96, partial [Firmicutes bacterium]|nr:hypothetical protein [Bacillota bacterium]